MGKTKTAFISDSITDTKTSAEKYAEKKAKREEKKVLQVEQVSQVLQEETQETIIQKKEIQEKQRSKKYTEAKAKINKSNYYKLKEAIELVKGSSYSKFDGTMELHLVLKKGGVNLNVSLPFSTGKQKKVEVADEATLEKLKTGKIDFDVLLATSDMMPKLVVFAKFLGPKGLMPNPKNGTVIKSEKEKDKFGGNSINLKSEKEAPLVHTSFGKVSQKTEELVKNAEIILDKLGGNKQIIRAYLKSTMSPSVKLEV